jgi:predicted CxxxxCH...CXXCH cytochrome family protein
LEASAPGRFRATGTAPLPPEPAGSTEHGIAAKMQEQACTSCHGADLTGGAGPSCDSCHDANGDGTPDDSWRTTCTFCHGGADGDATGAPPQDIDDNTNPATITFPAHRAHVYATDKHVAWDCTQCHVKPTNILSEGHIFLGDDTPGRADLHFADGLSPVGHYTGQTCSNLYCHGDGQGANGSIDADAGARHCDSCHPSLASDHNRWDSMSGDHEDHLDKDIGCHECHGLTTADDVSIVPDPSHHVNGVADVKLPAGMSRVGNECTGSCHGETHDGRNW